MDKYKSRTFWMVVAFVATATVLTLTGNLEGSGWTTTTLALFAGWQGRRYADNRLNAGGDE